jgi:hypothetical protein
VALDEYFKENPSLSISFIKIDVEGHELKALQGASDTLKIHHPILALELHVKKERTQSEDILEFLEQQGYGYAHVFKSNFFKRSKSKFIKIPINEFNRLSKKTTRWFYLRFKGHVTVGYVSLRYKILANNIFPVIWALCIKREIN